MAAISGVMRSLTRAVTTAPKATPMTTAIARSTTLPRRTKVLKPFMDLPGSFGHLGRLVARPRNGEHPMAGGVGQDSNDQVSGLVSALLRQAGTLRLVQRVRGCVHGPTRAAPCSSRLRPLQVDYG